MSFNDYCRLCKANMRVEGIYGHSRDMFLSKKTPSLSERLALLGVTVAQESGQSTRSCQRCSSRITRLERDLPTFKKWEEEFRNTDRNIAAKRQREPTPSKTPRALKKTCPNPPSPRPSSTRKTTTQGQWRRPKNISPDDVTAVPPGRRKIRRSITKVDADLFMECMEEELEPWQQIHENRVVRSRTKASVIHSRGALRPSFIWQHRQQQRHNGAPAHQHTISPHPHGFRSGHSSAFWFPAGCKPVVNTNTSCFFKMMKEEGKLLHKMAAKCNIPLCLLFRL
ncbi:uncharacterized protein LOC143119033 [Alosa pseudoharengus]|uniref:uncharacterized protein LOC143119033 n=1 Tax=Alosa pseudoharengus TaxID=34774 RepID=UPI003F89F16D